jgi:hypothetical protein
MPLGSYNGPGNFTDDPLFIATNDFRLSENSPCRDRGFNSYSMSEIDLDGNPRITHVAVDLGAYEFQGPEPADPDGDLIPTWWEMRFGLNPLVYNGASSDDDGMSDGEEFIADTNPTNGASYFALSLQSDTLSLLETSPDRMYDIFAITNLLSNDWTPVATNFPGIGTEWTFSLTNFLDAEYFKSIVRKP